METNSSDVRRAGEALQSLVGEVGKIVVGQRALAERILIGLLANGHLLIEGVPGLAKTLMVKSMAEGIHAQFERIQFTPDLLPGDLIGTQIYNQRTGDFSIKKGPIFTNFLLADEINRAPAKVQSALLEAMQERQVTIGSDTFKLPHPYLVMATQNPIENDGTYPLPEAQVDRFMLKVVVDYPTREEEYEILNRMTGATTPKMSTTMTIEELDNARKIFHQIYIDDRVKHYILDLVFATRKPEQYGLAQIKPYIEFGASPRATIFMTLAAKGAAFLQGRAYVTPDDVKHMALDVLRHRLIATYEAEAENITSENLVAQILNRVRVP
ncbi:MAG TPA: MoxR family ATPase [Herpetosiphon sp.]|uniref:ATPase associated with various cellular activities AAA_3 n=2 Tax=Herpetosiphon TaxID=64 RepID=A9B371_HERA2|nr:MoxR family ATPase [Herpetosiphon sp.]ABX07534.1 ATPase associated with various cellular activities AAA_3 [Herpetosiphon aurantiacus DSM 785]MCA0354186.1 MoxR family ATPase [Chloroflexota bacterium]HBW49220.1 MoxR family ATPase [Herpetosiphon sp.]